MVGFGERGGHGHGSFHLRRAEDVGVHAVLLGEDEGDNALGQCCLRKTKTSSLKLSKRGASLQSPRERGGEKGEEALCVCACVPKSKAKASVAALYRHTN